MGEHGRELEALARLLLKNKKNILDEWEKKMREVGDTPTQLAAMSRQEFLNSIPTFLDHLSDSLKGRKLSLRQIGKEHGSQRWEHGFDLSITVKEWGMLQKVIQNKIFSICEQSDKLDYRSLNQAHQVLTAHIQQGIEYSIKEFDQLRKKESEVQLRNLKLAMEKPDDKMRAHNLRSTSHDLKGIMYSLQLGFKLLQDENLSPAVSDLTTQMKEAADNLEQLLSDLMDLFRLETKQEEMKVSEFDAAETLRNLCESLQPMAKSEKLQLVYQGAASLRVRSDQKKIQRIAHNLLLNALKYTAEGSVTTGCKKITDDQWLLEVSDTGPGLNTTHAKTLTASENEEQNAFSSHYQNSTLSNIDSHGEGIGLLIVRHLCKLLDASIEIDAQPGEGTTFKIVFPLDSD